MSHPTLTDRVVPVVCDTGSRPFTDDAAGSYAADAIACLYQLGITTGTSATTFDPSSAVTREEAAALLARTWTALGNDCPDDPHPFTDVAAGSYADGAIACLYQLGITTGTSATTFDPSSAVTRQQAAAFIARLITQP